MCREQVSSRNEKAPCSAARGQRGSRQDQLQRSPLPDLRILRWQAETLASPLLSACGRPLASQVMTWMDVGQQVDTGSSDMCLCSRMVAIIGRRSRHAGRQRFLEVCFCLLADDVHGSLLYAILLQGQSWLTPHWPPATRSCLVLLAVRDAENEPECNGDVDSWSGVVGRCHVTCCACAAVLRQILAAPLSESCKHATWRDEW